MAVIDIDNQSEYGPYSAVIGFNSDAVYGEVRIEPPFYPGLELLDDVQYEGEIVGTSVEFHHTETNENATVLSYEITGGPENRNNADLAVSGVRDLLMRLGKYANKELFRQEWAQFKYPREKE